MSVRNFVAESGSAWVITIPPGKSVTVGQDSLSGNSGGTNVLVVMDDGDLLLKTLNASGKFEADVSFGETLPPPP